MLTTAKPTQHMVMDNTKNSTANYPKSVYSISDVNKFYRRQQTYRKKLKALLETNCLLEARIKIYESTIKDERSTIVFQLNQLSKTMNSKISTYIDQKLDKDKFKDNEQAVQTIKEMISKFQTVQKETKVTKKVYQSLNSIHERYQQYSEQIDNLVKMTEKSNKEYEDGMKNMLYDKQNQIVTKRQINEDVYDNTQNMIKKIDQYESERLKLIDQEAQLEDYIEKLNKIQQQTKFQVDKFTEWAEIVIDKNHRKIFNKENKEKQAELVRISSNNKKLEVYLKQLENQEEILKNSLHQKENQITLLKKQKTSKTYKSNNNKTMVVKGIKNHESLNAKNIFVP